MSNRSRFHSSMDPDSHPPPTPDFLQQSSRASSLSPLSSRAKPRDLRPRTILKCFSSTTFGSGRTAE